MGTHYLDTINYLMGEIENIHSYKENFLDLYDVEDTISINVKLKK